MTSKMRAALALLRAHPHLACVVSDAGAFVADDMVHVNGRTAWALHRAGLVVVEVVDVDYVEIRLPGQPSSLTDYAGHMAWPSEKPAKRARRQR